MGDTMETVTVRVYYDFASTLCYVAHRVMCRIEHEIGELGVELEWRPIDLTMAAPWDRGDSFRPDIRAAVRNTGLTLGIDVEMPDPWLDSRPASQVALCLRTPADEARWRRAVFDTFFDRKTPRLTPDLERLARDLTGSRRSPTSRRASTGSRSARARRSRSASPACRASCSTTGCSAASTTTS